MKSSEIDSNWLEQVFQKAVRAVYEHDGALIQERAHERSLMFHLGRHMAADFAASSDPWNVDLEYNRASNDELLRVAKHLPSSRGRKASNVFPDLIVHERSNPSADVNLLVVEAKHAPARTRVATLHQQREADYAKLRGYQTELAYRFAAYLEFPPFPTPPGLILVDRLAPGLGFYADNLEPKPMW